LPVGMAVEHQPPLGLAGVDPTKRWRGEGHEQPWMGGHSVGDALAAPQPGGQELVAVGLVGRRAGGTHRHPSVAAGFQEGGVRLPVGRVNRADFARGSVGVLDPAAQPHRAGAVAGGRHLLGPAVIAGAGTVDHLLQDAREQLAQPDRPGHAASPGAGMSGTTRSPGACPANSSAGSARSPVVARMMAATWWWSTWGVRTRWNPGRPGRLVTATPT